MGTGSPAALAKGMQPGPTHEKTPTSPKRTVTCGRPLITGLGYFLSVLFEELPGRAIDPRMSVSAWMFCSL